LAYKTVNPISECQNYRPVNLLTKYSLEGVHKRFKKWFYMTPSSKYVLDIVLATYISNELDNIPLWFLIEGASGDLKTETLSGLVGYPKVIEVNELNNKSFISLQKDVIDLGHRLQQKHRVIIVRDAAALTSLPKDQKKEIIGKLRTLYDGYLERSTGVGTKFYGNITASLLINTTEAIRRDMIMNQELGTRELIINTESKRSDNTEKMKAASKNEAEYSTMKKEIKEVIHGFLAHHRISGDINIPSNVKNELMNLAQRLSLLRTSIDYNQYTREIEEVPTPEVPTRLIQQYTRLYKALKSLSTDYPDEKALTIIRKVTQSSGDRVRANILRIFLKDKDEYTRTRHEIPYHSVLEISNIVRVGWVRTKRELDFLWSMAILDRIKTQTGSKSDYKYKINPEGYV
jgi:hypothetical protein